MKTTRQRHYPLLGQGYGIRSPPLEEVEKLLASCKGHASQRKVLIVEQRILQVSHDRHTARMMFTHSKEILT